jgi:MFS transporter, CP family, cyanate transporter
MSPVACNEARRASAGGWSMIAWFYLVGVLASAQLGKMSALVPLIGRDLALSLTVVALVVSLLEIGGATLGYAAGALVSRLGQRRVLLVGVALIAGAGIGQCTAMDSTALVTWRICEAIGYLCVVVAAPLLIIGAALPSQEGSAMALWSSFVPVGFAIGAVTSGLAADLWGWRPALLSWSAVALVVLAVSARLPIENDHVNLGRRRSRPSKQVLALTLAFGCYAMFAVGVTALLPMHLVSRAGASPGAAGAMGASASFVTVLGIGCAAWLQRRPRLTAMAMVSALVIPALTLFAVFRDDPVLPWAFGLSLLLNAVSGICPGLAFARLPRLARTVDQMSIANGMVLQFGAAGSLLGPPLFAACADHWGWTGAAMAGLVVSLLCLLLMLWAGLTDARDAPGTTQAHLKADS